MLLLLILFNASNELRNCRLYSGKCIAAIRILTSTSRNIALRIESSMIGQYLEKEEII